MRSNTKWSFVSACPDTVRTAGEVNKLLPIARLMEAKPFSLTVMSVRRIQDWARFEADENQPTVDDEGRATPAGIEMMLCDNGGVFASSPWYTLIKQLERQESCAIDMARLTALAMSHGGRLPATSLVCSGSRLNEGRATS